MAQEEKLVPIKVSKYDTNYYCSYEERLVVGLYQSSQNYNLEITQKQVSDTAGKSHINYFGDAAAVNGLEFSYDKLHLSFAYKTLPILDSDKKGYAKYKGLGLGVGGNKWRLESYYRTYSWFYDLNTALYDTTYTTTKPYYQNKSMSVTNFKTKFMYFFKHKKFSYCSAYSCNQRQLKSVLSPVFVANVYYNTTTADSSFIPHFIRPFYGYNADINGLRTIAYSAGGGFAGTLVVYKRFFINGMLIIGLESQHSQYHHYNSNTTNNATYINWAGDFRAAAGFNNRNFYMTINVINDFSTYNSGLFNMSANFKGASITLGYRFKVKEPKFMTAVRNTKLYQLF